MAVAIFNGFNHKENCIHFVKSQVEIEKETASGLAMQVEQEKDIVVAQQQNIIDTRKTGRKLIVFCQSVFYIYLLCLHCISKLCRSSPWIAVAFLSARSYDIFCNFGINTYFFQFFKRLFHQTVFPGMKR